jgi:hypothetical protein
MTITNDEVNYFNYSTYSVLILTFTVSTNYINPFGKSLGNLLL